MSLLSDFGTLRVPLLDFSQPERVPTAIAGICWSALPDLNRGPPDGCLQPSVSSLQSGAL